MDNTQIKTPVGVANSGKKVDVKLMTELALLTAIVILMAFTPLGYLRIGITQITFIVVPVAVGAVVLGPKAGAFLGLVFGLSSFAQPESLAMFSMMPAQVFISCVVPRIFVGLVPAYAYKGLLKLCKKRQVATAVACVIAPLTNTILFLSFMVIFMGDHLIAKYPDIYGAMAGQGFFTFFGVMLAGVTLNVVLETASCLIIASAVCNALWHTANKN